MPQGLVARAPGRKAEEDRNGLGPPALIEQDDSDCDVSLSTHTYTLHGRWPLLQATSVSARLQLAAVYAGPGSLAPLPGCLGGMAGLEAALTLVRQCRVSYPLALGDVDQVRRITGFGVPLLPALSIACHALEEASLELRFLYTEGNPRWRPELEWATPHASFGGQDAQGYGDTQTAYLLKCRQMPAHSRRRLTEEEVAQELACAGGLMYVGVAAGPGLGLVAHEHGTLEVGPCPVAGDYVVAVERELCKLRVEREKQPLAFASASMPAYPLLTPRGPQALSYSPADSASPDRAGKLGMPAATVLSREMNDELRASWELHQRAPAVALPDNLTPRSPALLSLFRGALAQVSADRSHVERHILDALGAMPSWGGWHAAASRMLVSASLLPSVTLQDVARMACDTSLISQFNPFLSSAARGTLRDVILVWLQIDTVRLNLLSSLLDEAHDYLHGCLCAGMLGRRLTLLPFNRDIKLTERGARTLVHHVDRLASSGGIILAAPEHRLSLKLKWHELAAKPGSYALCRLLETLDNRDVIDILDESDELLHHRRELVYACGAPVSLPNGVIRWTAMQALFWVLPQGIATHGEIQRILVRPGLRACLLEGLMHDPPYEMSWPGRRDVERDARIVRFVTDLDPGPDERGLLGAILPEGGLHEEERASLLILRGLLAGNMLFHELEKRHLVEYGVDRRKGSPRKKRLAVPFRAHNQPSDRSEWAHPDAALLLTTLA
eukprot:jgi/Mesvir1/21537/Mv03978-RA.1